MKLFVELHVAMILDVHLVNHLGYIGQIWLARRRTPDQRVLLPPPVHHDARTCGEEANDKRASNSEANDEWHVEVVG